MRILYVSDRQKGGIKNHVQCLRRCLPEDVEHYTIGEDEPHAGKNGHDIREFFQIRRVIKSFRPDIVHFNGLPLFMAIYVKFFTKLPSIISLHTPYDVKIGFGTWFRNWLMRKSYFLPVSGPTWRGFKRYFPKARGEVFFNPIEIPADQKIPDSNVGETAASQRNEPFVAGLVGRYADQKDWPAFAEVTKRVSQKKAGVCFWGVGVSAEEAKSELGDLSKHIDWKGFQANGREWVGKMDLFVLTSKHEQLPTVVLEAFMMKTAICGYIPKGGTSDILSFSNGALKEVFIEERDPDKLAAIVLRLVEDDELRRRVIEDGWQIVTRHFDAMKNCRGQLVEVYKFKV